mmetsp:Transcript_65963/g.132848  ORF Transcript_65963/g.132848 Transcript_65963/m.132848 type:complete len:244 (-) Transcript_65963:297-1028(-)
MATRSIPTHWWHPDANATLSLVPTPSVAPTRTTSSSPLAAPAAAPTAPNPAAVRSNKPPKPPKSASQPGRRVDLQAGLMRSTSKFPASMSTPASLYVVTAPPPPPPPPLPVEDAASGPISPCLNWEMASRKATPSSACTLVLRLSAVSPLSTAHVFCTTIPPPSTWDVTQCTVHPDSVCLAFSTAECTSSSMPPANKGRRLGCTFRQRFSQVAQKDSLRMRIHPTHSTRSTPLCSRAEVTCAS